MYRLTNVGNYSFPLNESLLLIWFVNLKKKFENICAAFWMYYFSFYKCASLIIMLNVSSIYRKFFKKAPWNSVQIHSLDVILDIQNDLQMDFHILNQNFPRIFWKRFEKLPIIIQNILTIARNSSTFRRKLSTSTIG